MFDNLRENNSLRKLRTLFSPIIKSREVENYELALNETYKGYSNLNISEVVAAKTKIFIQSEPLEVSINSIKPLIGLLYLGDLHGKVVVDFGGGAGFHYFLAKKILSTETRFQWVVVETPNMVSAAKDFESQELIFTTSIEKVSALMNPGNQKVDILIASSVLQYLPSPLTTLRSLIALNPEFIYIARTPLSLDLRHVIVQESPLSSNGPGKLPEGFKDAVIKYPATFEKKSDFESVLQEKYIIQYVILEEEHGFNVGGMKINTFGYFCKRR